MAQLKFADLRRIAEEFDATKSYPVDDYCMYQGLFYRFINDHSGAWSSADVVQTDVGSELSDFKNDLSGIAVEYYDKAEEKQIDISSYLVSQRLLYITLSTGTINVVANSAYKYYEIPTDGISKIKTDGFSGANIKSVVFATDENELVKYYPEESIPSPGTGVTVECDVPEGATKMFLVGKTNTNVTLYVPAIVISFVANDALRNIIEPQTIGTETLANIYDVGIGNWANEINLYGSNNGLFNFRRIKKNGKEFKNCTDDITPLQLIDVGYIGANHGYALAYKYTYASPHGLTESDIGKTYKPSDSTADYILLQVPSTTTLIVGRLSDHWTRLYPNIAGNAFDFGTGEITSTSEVLTQIYPSLKNGVVEVVENTPSKMTVSETYDIIDIGTGIDAIIANVGNNTNDSIAELSDSLVTVRNLYEFHNEGDVVIYQNIKVLKSIQLNHYGGVQSMAFSTNGFFSVPMTSYKTLQQNTQALDFGRATWNDETVPPVLYVQSDADSASATKMMLLGFVSGNRNSEIKTSAGSIVGTSKKMYPYLVNPGATVDVGTIFSGVSFRVPISLDLSEKVGFNYTIINDEIYMFIVAREAISTSIEIPEGAYGKAIKEIMADGIVCETKVSTNVIDIVSSGFGCAMLKFSTDF